jgi:hypothetical protein
MRYSMWVLLTVLTLGLASSSGCFGPVPNKPISEEEKKKIDDDMQKARELNENAPKR